MHKNLLIAVIVAALLLGPALFCFAQSASEQITLTTYYPSPYGVYKSLRIYPSNVAPATCDANTAGTMYFSGTYASGGILANAMYFCDGTRWRSTTVHDRVSVVSTTYTVEATGNRATATCPTDHPYLINCSGGYNAIGEIYGCGRDHGVEVNAINKCEVVSALTCKPIARAICAN
ncbi:MAG: hypothetical protein PHU91_01675 [Candidatus Omnitrophica bacterium]|nr:hypothetical protein [Candidatus Omnitrophota bacterium]MDD5236365.1 hypothetical protein [Candidatus Omnitrophota bacterium]MDD5610700.1 hypothetical protein [Candidatus Omnitrophota bacterium]